MRAALTLSCLLLVSACAQTDATSTGSSASTKGASTTKTDPTQTAPDEAPQPAADLIREAPGVELAKLDEAKRELFFQALNSEASACGQAHSLAVSLRDDEDCRDSVLVAQFIADRIAIGAQPGDVKLEAEALVNALQVRAVPIEGRPVYGYDRAPVTVVVFADFQCPMCKAEAPQLREAVDGRRGQVKLVFKHFPLTQVHPRSEAVAIAAEAAGLQGKFWEMHDKLFANQEAVEDADFERYATEIGLDVAKWKADMTSESVKLAVAQDQADGMKLELQGTPTVYVDGRLVVPMLWDGHVDGWIDDALRR